MEKSYKTGLGFGLTSGIITTLGLIVGLFAGTHSKQVVLAGILTIAIADAFSDSLGIHISEESKTQSTTLDIWKATITTFISKMLFALIFIIPLLLMPINSAVIVSVIIGMVILGIFSYYIGVSRNSSPIKTIIEHLLIGLVVIFLTNYLGNVISETIIK